VIQLTSRRWICWHYRRVRRIRIGRWGVAVQARDVYMDWLIKRALLISVVLGLFVPISTFQVRAQATANFCFGTACFTTLEEAESAMRASSVYGPLAEKAGTERSNITETTQSTRIVYRIPNQAPISIGAPVYTIGGWAASEGICPASGDPVYPNYCYDEGAVAKGMVSYLQSQYPQCSFGDERFEGDVGEPFVRSGTISSSTSLGYLDFYPPLPENSRFFFVRITCPGTSNTLDYQIYKRKSFACAAGYSPATGYSAEYASASPASEVLTLGTLCVPAVRFLYINVVKNTQTSSCAINSNPCFPATGDKARIEPDFDFAGLQYVRYYHSLGMNQSDERHGIGWSDTFSDNVPYPTVRFSESGYLERYVAQTSYRYRGQKNAGDYITQAAAGKPYVLTKASGEVRTYDNSTHKLTSIALPNAANKFTIGWVGGRISSVTDKLGRSISFNYDARGRVSAISLPGGGVVRYEYDGDRNLTKVIREDGSERTYLYGESGKAPAGLKNLMTGIVDDGVRYATFSYDAYRRATSSALEGGGAAVEKVEITYDSVGNAEVVNALGAQHSYTIGGTLFRDIAGSSASGISTSATYSAYGRLASITDGRGKTTTFGYNDALGADVSQVKTTTYPDGRVVTIVRDQDNQVKEQRVTGPDGLVRQLERRVHDAAGRLVYACDYKDSASSYVCGSLGVSPSGVRQVQYSYCSVGAQGCPVDGLVATIDGSRKDLADITQFTYRDPSSCSGGDCTYRAGDLWKVTNALGHVTEVLAYDGAGRPIQVADADGVVSSYTYDARGRVIHSAQTDTGDTTRVTSWTYWPSGLLKSVTDPDNVTTTFTYDSAQRLRRITDGQGNVMDYTLDPAGNVVLEEVKDASGALKRTASRIYNQLGQLKTLADASANPTDYTYDANGNRLSTIDALGRAITQEYDPLNRLTKVVQDLGGIAATTSMQYDVLGNITQVIDPKGLATTYTYNGFGELQNQVSPDTGTTQFTYDDAGNVATRTDSRGVTATYTYDALNRLTAVQYPTAGNDIGYVYDTASPLCQAGETFAIGRLSWMTDASGRTDYCYNRFGEIVRKVQQANGISLAIRYSYTAGGRLASLTYPDGTVADYVRDTQGRIAEIGVTPPSGLREVLLTGVTYLPFGPSTGWRYGNGRTLVRNFDQDYRPIGIADSKQDLKLGFGYDPVGDLVDLASGGQQIKLQYDALGRLTHFKDGPSGATIDQYTYDATGNRTSFSNAAGTVPYGYPADSHRLVSVGGEPRTYDAMGNTTSIGGADREFVYDERGRMAQVKRNGAVAQDYRYNAKGEQVARLGGSGAGLLLYDESGHSLGDYDVTGLAGQQVIWMDDAPVGLLGEGALSYVEPDHLGTPRVVADPVRDEAVWGWDLKGEAFGREGVSGDPDRNGQSLVFSMRFPGQRYSAGSDLNYNYSRDYDFETGRFIEADPTGLEGGLSTFGYVGGSPLRWSDPSGLVRWDGRALPGTLGFGAVAGGLFVFDLTSQCVNGKRARVLVRAKAAGFGIGWHMMPPATATAGGVTLQDYLPEISPKNFNGLFYTHGIGVNAGPVGYGCNGYQIGSQWTPAVTKMVDCGGGEGADASANLLLGQSELVRVIWSDCDECDPVDTPFK